MDNWERLRLNLFLPKRISPCPIVEAIVEFRFESSVPDEAVFGVVYSAIGNPGEFRVENLPLLQLPEQIRRSDPELAFQPLHRLHDKNFLIQIAPKAISFVSKADYLGWEAFRSRLSNLYQAVLKSHVIQKVTRIGVRYVNFFEKDVWENVRISITSGDLAFPAEAKNLRSTVRTGEFLTTVQVGNQHQVVIDGKLRRGSLIDLDTHVLRSIHPEQGLDLVERAHLEEKRTFYALLTDEFVASLNPEYD